MGAFNNFLGSSSGGLVTGALSGLANFGFQQWGAKLQHERDLEKMQKQQDYALEQMSQSQQYNLDNMAKQNEYQIAAENRANAYNSVGSQVERARQAGVSPLAALGSGGAGGTMSVSSAPSGGSPSGSAPSGGVPSAGGAQFFDFARSIELGASVALKASQAGAADAAANASNAAADASKALEEKYRSEITLNNQRVEEIKQSIDESKQRVANMQIENTILGFQKTILGAQADSAEAVKLSTIAKSQYEVWFYSCVRDGRTPAQRECDAQYEYYFARAALDNANAANIKLLTGITNSLKKYIVGAETTRLNRVMLENTAAMPFLQQLKNTPKDKIVEFVNANIQSAIDQAKIVANKAEISEKDVAWYTANAILQQVEGYTGVAVSISQDVKDWIAASLTGGGSTVITQTVNKNGKGIVTGTSETKTVTTPNK